MNKLFINKKGSILVYVMLTNSFIIVLATILLSTVSLDLKMKKINSDAKRALYLAEAGIEEAYIILLKSIDLALECGINDQSDDTFVDFMQNDLINILDDNINYEIFETGYPIIDSSLIKSGDSFNLKISSIYKRESVERIVVLECIIDIPKGIKETDDDLELEIGVLGSNTWDHKSNQNFMYNDKTNRIEARDLVHIIKWKVEK